MNWVQEILSDTLLEKTLLAFLKIHGKDGLIQALQFYSNLQQEYIYKTKDSIVKIKMGDILYLEIHQHAISIHTESGIFCKYGSLQKELQALPAKEFIQCSKKCAVSIRKIKSIQGKDITLINNAKIHLSRSFTRKVLIAYSHYPNAKPSEMPYDSEK